MSKRSTRISISTGLDNSMHDDKEHLNGLNSRLAEYIEKVRQLERENNRLEVQIRDVEVIEKKERGDIAKRFEDEKKRLRLLIDDLEKREARAAMERDKAVVDHDRLQARIAKLERDYAKSEDERLTAIAKADEAQAKFRTMQARMDKIEADNKDLMGHNASLRNQVNSLQKALEDEVLQKTAAQNELARLAEDLDFLKRQHACALDEVRTKRQVDMTTYQKQVVEDYQSKLQEELTAFNIELKIKLAEANDKFEKQYKSKLQDANDARSRALAESASLRTRVSQLEKNGSSSEVLLDALRRELQSLKEKEKDLREQYDAQLAEKDRLNAELSAEIQRLMDEYRSYLTDKLTLDAEINTYRILLEGEEERLNLTGKSAHDTSNVTKHHASFSTGSASRGTKRRRVTINGDSDFDYHNLRERIQKETTGDVGIDEVDPDGKWVRVINTGPEEVSLARYALTVRAGSQEATFKFSNRMKLASGATCTIYSADSGHKAHLPESVTMKSQNWPVGEDPSVRLEDPEGDTVSTVTLEASESNDPSNPSDKCTIM